MSKFIGLKIEKQKPQMVEPEIEQTVKPKPKTQAKTTVKKNKK